MLTTGCEGCCFLQNNAEGKGCVLNQLCVVDGDHVYAPGYCRLCRSGKWAQKQGTIDINKLCASVIEECAITFDMLVFFDEHINSIEDLKRTLNSDWYEGYAKKIIIADVTGFGERQNLALQYLKSRKHTVPTIVDSSVDHELPDQREDTIRRLSKKVTSPFFLAVPAGRLLKNLEATAKTIQNLPTRVIHWAFPEMIGATTIIPQKLDCGLFITKPYRALTKLPEADSLEEIASIKSFTERLREKEKETNMGLSWFQTDCWAL